MPGEAQDAIHNVTLKWSELMYISRDVMCYIHSEDVYAKPCQLLKYTHNGHCLPSTSCDLLTLDSYELLRV
jgi:hypothetical protein